MDQLENLITETDIQSYENNGVWISPPIIPLSTIQNLQRAFSSIWRGELDKLYLENQLNFEIVEKSEKSELKRVFNAFLINSVINEVVTTSKIGYIASQIMQVNNVKIWYTQNIEKPSDSQITSGSANIGWHQDYKYWQCCSANNMCTAWIPLQDTTVDNGAMRVVKGSHKWGLIQEHKGFHDKDLRNNASILKERIRQGWDEEIITIKAGQVSFHHCLVLHGSGPNYSDTSRLAIAVHLMPSTNTYSKTADCHQSLTFLGNMPSEGEEFIGHHWPHIRVAKQ